MKKKNPMPSIGANATLKEVTTRDKKVVASLGFTVADPAEARYIVRVDFRTILLPYSREKFLKLKKRYGNGIDKGPKFKTLKFKGK